LGDACIDLDEALTEYAANLLALDLEQSPPAQFQEALDALNNAQKRLDDFHEALLQATDPAVHRELRTHHRLVMQCIGADAQMLIEHVAQAKAKAPAAPEPPEIPVVEKPSLPTAAAELPARTNPAPTALRALGRQRPYVPDLTVSAGVPNGQFYRESQRMMYCGMHALNAMLGGHFISEKDIEQADTLRDALDLAGSQIGSNALAKLASKLMGLMSRVSTRGTDITVMLEALRQRMPDIWNSAEFAACTNRQSLADKQEAVIQILDLSNLQNQEQDTDRMVLGTNAHWFAFRKDAQGQWWRLDSLLPNPVAQSPSEFAAMNIRIGKQDQSNLIGGFYLNPAPIF
jgi:hypothetical protein